MSGELNRLLYGLLILANSSQQGAEAAIHIALKV
jgi:hypothetical protein